MARILTSFAGAFVLSVTILPGSSQFGSSRSPDCSVNSARTIKYEASGLTSRRTPATADSDATCRQVLSRLIETRGPAAGVKVDTKEALSRLRELVSSFPEKQAAELRRYFTVELGLPSTTDRATLSKSNQTRILSQLGEVNDVPDSLAIKKILSARLDSYFSYFVHNTASKARTPPFWFSSFQLERLGVEPGLQANGFNKDYLGTQDWIFFFVGDPFEERYGENPVELKLDYAQAAGIVSPYIMYESDLLNMAARMDPSFESQIQSLFIQHYPKAWHASRAVYDKAVKNGLVSAPFEYYQIRIASRKLYLDDVHLSIEGMVAKHPKVFSQAKAAQSRMIFTPEDFIIVAKEVLYRWVLQKYFSSGKWDTAKLLEDTRDRKRIAALLQEAYVSKHLPILYELKIPTLIESKHFLPFEATHP